MGKDFNYNSETMTRDYIVVTNRTEILKKLSEKGIDNCLLLDHELISDDDVKRIASSGKCGYYYIMYLTDIEQYRDVYRTVSEQKIYGQVISNILKMPFDEIDEYKGCDGVWNDEDNRSPYISLMRFLEILDVVMPWMDLRAESKGWILHTDYENRCGNCNTLLSEADKYCTICGTKRGEGDFKPYNNKTDYLYGCPAIMKWKCNSCGYVWVNWSYDKKRYCPECGALGVFIKEDVPRDMIEVLDMTPEEDEMRKKRLLEEN